MNRNYLATALVLLLAAALWLAHRSGIPAPLPSSAQAGRSPSAEAGASPTSAHSTLGLNVSNSTPSAATQPRRANTPEELLKEKGNALEESRNQWRTPIEFYGKVIDEGSNGVADAQIDFDCNDTSAEGTSFYHAVSDQLGMFSLNGVKGKIMTVKVTKSGHYASKRDNDSFEYGDRYAHFTPDRANPVVFHLLKQGIAEPLVHVQSPMGGAKDYRIARDGTPLEISLSTGQIVPAGEGDLRIECWTDDLGKPRTQKYDWKCRISAPGGGLLAYSEEFPFLAPTEAYQPSDQIDMPATLQAGWASSAKRNYFVRLANGTFARLSFQMIAGGGHFFQLESFLNPSGSRNLEYDPAVRGRWTHSTVRHSGLAWCAFSAG